MSDRRLARTLLRLYPRAWRARYGEEFLAYVGESGLTWPSVVDIIGAAGVERGRSILDAARAQVDTAPLPVHDPPVIIGVGTIYGPILFRGALISMLVALFHAAGVPYPQWGQWFNLIFFVGPYLDRSTTTTSWFDRGLAAFLWFALGLALCLVATALATALLALGVPVPPEAVTFGTFIALAAAIALRGISRGVKAGLRPAHFEPISAAEMRLWRIAAFGSIAVMAMDQEFVKAFWLGPMFLTATFTLPPAMTRSGWIRRRTFEPPTTGAE